MDSNPWFRLFSTKRPISATLAFSAREAEGVSEAGGAGEGLAAGRVTSDVCVFRRRSGQV